MERIEFLRRAERTALLARLCNALEADPRVASAWLHGSLGMGTADAWSDIDLWVVLFDAEYSDEIRYAFVEGALFTEEAPQNSPAGGTYLMSAHDAPTGPHLVDWYFQPLRFAEAGEGRQVLIDRAPLPFQPGIAPIRTEWQPSAGEVAANKAALFWAMILIQAKYIARKPVEAGMGFEGFLLSLLHGVAEWRGREIEEQETPNLLHAADKIERLRSLGKRMEEIAPGFSGPSAAIERFLDTVTSDSSSREQ